MITLKIRGGGEFAVDPAYITMVWPLAMGKRGSNVYIGEEFYEVEQTVAEVKAMKEEEEDY